METRFCRLPPLSDYFRHTKIIATVGPATKSREMPAQLITAGVDILRLNMAHASHPWVKDVIGFVREVLTPGKVGSKRRLNLPGVFVNLPSLTRKDEDDLKAGVEAGIDFVARSFVRQAEDIRTLPLRQVEQIPAATPVPDLNLAAFRKGETLSAKAKPPQHYRCHRGHPAIHWHHAPNPVSVRPFIFYRQSGGCFRKRAQHPLYPHRRSGIRRRFDP